MRHGQVVIEAHQHAFHLREVGEGQFDIGGRDGDVLGQADDLGDGGQLGIGMAAAGRDVIGHGAGNADTVAHLHGGGVGGRGEDEQAVRGLRIAVARLVLDEEAGTDLGGNHALGGLHRAGHRAGRTAALDLRDGTGERGRRGDFHVDRAHCLLRLVVVEADADRIGASRQAGCHGQVGRGGAASGRRRLEIGQRNAAHGAGGNRCSIDDAVGIAGGQAGSAAQAHGQRQVGRAVGHDRRLGRHATLLAFADSGTRARGAGGKIAGVVVGVGAAAVGAQRGQGIGQAGTGSTFEAAGVIAEQVHQCAAGRAGAGERGAVRHQRHLAGGAAHGKRPG